MKLVLLGPPGAGKGTQACKISERLGIPHISTGDILRNEVAKGSSLGKKALGYMNEGKLVPDEIILEIIKNRIVETDASRGFLMDGFPRNLKQARMFSEILNSLDMKLDRVINIEVSQDEIIKRLSNRRVCEGCGKVYKVDGGDLNIEEKRCERCGGKLKKRSDDEINVILNRLKVYENETKPLVDYYTSEGLVINVDGNGNEEEVTKRILESL
ncbi:MAG: adenylate kinase [Actinobacteria bacterium]|nr:adenylate kinase [Actinomycetota bacterium]